MSYASEAKEMRQHKRYKVNETEIHVKLTFAHEVEINDISLGGISLKVDRRINIGKEYLLKLEYKNSELSAKGIVVWALLSKAKADLQGNVIPIYSCGLKFKNATDEQIKQFIALIEKHNEGDNGRRGNDLQADEFVDLSVQFKEALEEFT